MHKIEKVVLIVVLLVFITPFILIPFGDFIFSIGPFYTAGIGIKDFFTVWIASFGVIGVVYNIRQNQKRISQQEKQLDLQSKSERNSRFTKGVELLGNSQESARTGGAYSLIFLAKEYPAEFKTIVFNTLCSHIRTITNTDDYQDKYPDEPSIEIETLISFLFYDLDNFFSTEVANLSKSYLSGANLRFVDLRMADLSWADLSAADLSKADLSEAYLYHAKLFSTELVGAKLIETDLTEADLYGANLSNTNLSLTILYKTIMTDVDLSEAIFDKDTFRSVIK